jgi:hypothetical protein
MGGRQAAPVPAARFQHQVVRWRSILGRSSQPRTLREHPRWPWFEAPGKIVGGDGKRYRCGHTARASVRSNGSNVYPTFTRYILSWGTSGSFRLDTLVSGPFSDSKYVGQARPRARPSPVANRRQSSSRLRALRSRRGTSPRARKMTVSADRRASWRVFGAGRCPLVSVWCTPEATMTSPTPRGGGVGGTAKAPSHAHGCRRRGGTLVVRPGAGGSLPEVGRDVTWRGARAAESDSLLMS